MKERRRQWAQKLTPRSLPKGESIKETEKESPEESELNKGMLPDDIVKLLAEREKYVHYLLMGIFILSLHAYMPISCCDFWEPST